MSHQHDWEPATPSDVAAYFGMNQLTSQPRWFVRLEKCRTCPQHQLIVLDAETGKHTVRDTDYR